jgi:hypothetical protein
LPRIFEAGSTPAVTQARAAGWGRVGRRVGQRDVCGDDDRQAVGRLASPPPVGGRPARRFGPNRALGFGRTKRAALWREHPAPEGAGAREKIPRIIDVAEHGEE